MQSMPTNNALPQASWRLSKLVIEKFACPGQRQQSAGGDRSDQRRPSGGRTPSKTRRRRRASKVECGLKPAEDFLCVRREHHQWQERDDPKILEHEVRTATQTKHPAQALEHRTQRRTQMRA